MSEEAREQFEEPEEADLSCLSTAEIRCSLDAAFEAGRLAGLEEAAGKAPSIASQIVAQLEVDTSYSEATREYEIGWMAAIVAAAIREKK